MATTLITGANRGIGLEFCKQYSARGEQVIAVCRKASDELHALDGVRIEEGIDVASLTSVTQLAERLQDINIDVLISNAGVLKRQTLGDIDEQALEDMRMQYQTNSLGPLLVTQALLGHLQAGAKIGIVTSRVGSVADNTSGGQYGYRMSKAAANMAGKSLAEDLKDRGIAVALLHPGYVRTEMTGGSGYIDAQEAASGLIQRMDELGIETTGTFWHSNGEPLPW